MTDLRDVEGTVCGIISSILFGGSAPVQLDADLLATGALTSLNRMRIATSLQNSFESDLGDIVSYGVNFRTAREMSAAVWAQIERGRGSVD